MSVPLQSRVADSSTRYGVATRHHHFGKIIDRAMHVIRLFSHGPATIADIGVAGPAVIARASPQRILRPHSSTMPTGDRAKLLDSATARAVVDHYLTVKPAQG